MAIDELRSLFLFDGLRMSSCESWTTQARWCRSKRATCSSTRASPSELWWVLLGGRIELLRRSGHEVSVIAAMDQPGLWAGGFMAWTDSVGYLATAATDPGRILRGCQRRRSGTSSGPGSPSAST